ncbi:MAG TPA: hypothetical protein H9671_04825 [Firmicutes bacterium]|nr:hypothetical protein [Bacillota bacterium]
MRKSAWSSRSLVAWCLILTGFVGIIALILTQQNTVLLIFDKGTLHLNSFEEISEQVEKDYLTYDVLFTGSSSSGLQIFEYRTSDNLAYIRVTAEENTVTCVEGTLNTQDIPVTGIVTLKETVENIFIPVIRPGDMTAFEISLIQEILETPDVLLHYQVHKNIGGAEIYTTSTQDGAISFILRPNRIGS